MEILSLIDGLSADNVADVYLLHGKERFFINELVRALKSIVVTGPMADFNFVRLQAGTVSADEIVTRAREIPMLASRRLLLIDDGHKLNKKDLETLDPYLADPSPETCLVLVADKLDMRRGPLSRAAKRGQVLKTEPLKDRDLPSFLRWRAKVRGIAFNPGALRELAAAVGPDCSALDDAIERLGLFVGPSREVTENDVAEVVTSVREHSIFELVDAIGNGKSGSAMTLLVGLLARREEPLRINAMVARHFRMLLGARIELHRGTAEHEMASSLGVPPFVARKLATQARRFRGADLERSLARLARADLELKSARRPASLVVEQAVLDLSMTR